MEPDELPDEQADDLADVVSGDVGADPDDGVDAPEAEVDAGVPDTNGSGGTLAWTGLAVGVGTALVVVQALFVLVTLIQGLSLHRTGPGSFPGDIFHRIGIAFSTSVNIPSGLALVVGALLVAAPAIAGVPIRRVPGWAAGLRGPMLAAVDVVALVIAVGTVLGVRASVRLDDLQGGSVSTFQRWELTAYLVGTLGTALVAFVTGLACPRYRTTT